MYIRYTRRAAMNTAALIYAGASALLIISIFAIAFADAMRKNKWAVIDTAWGLGFVAVAGLGAALFPMAWQKITAAVLIGLWGIRLAWHLWRRNARLPEDPRYAAMKPEYEGKPPILIFRNVFLLQGVIMGMMCLPLYMFFPASLYEGFSVPAALGIGFCLLGLFWEWTADAQLKHFVATQKKVHPDLAITTGLWSLSRHPNYFGEITFWFGIWVLSLSPRQGQGAFAGLGIAAIGFLSPLLIALIISKVTGPMLEFRMKKYSNYQHLKEIPYIFPRLFPKIK